MRRQALVDYLDQLLQPGMFKDYCPNGLQVQGRDQVLRVMTGVTASQALIEAAVAWQADALLVHHGYFWKGEAAPIVGIKQQRIAALLQHEMSLLAYHLPLDAHPELGNNAQLAQVLGLQVQGPLQPEKSLAQAIGLWGSVAAQPLTQFAQQVEQALQRAPLCIAGHEGPVQKVAWCTGAAQGYIEQAAALGADTFISGEISEQTVHLARELGVHYVAAGHHATERYGVKALGERLAAECELTVRFMDIDNPV